AATRCDAALGRYRVGYDLDRVSMPDLAVTLGRLRLSNPILVASGTFGYARELAGAVDFAKLGGIIPKTVTRQPRLGSPPRRAPAATPPALHTALGSTTDAPALSPSPPLPFLPTSPTAVIANIAGENEDDFTDMAARVGREAGLAGLELNLSCPNVSGGL